MVTKISGGSTIPPAPGSSFEMDYVLPDMDGRITQSSQTLADINPFLGNLVSADELPSPSEANLVAEEAFDAKSLPDLSDWPSLSDFGPLGEELGQGSVDHLFSSPNLDSDPAGGANECFIWSDFLASEDPEWIIGGYDMRESHDNISMEAEEGSAPEISTTLGLLVALLCANHLIINQWRQSRDQLQRYRSSIRKDIRHTATTQDTQGHQRTQST